jgi:Zn-dependent peptidase ImmA (M78 family)
MSTSTELMPITPSIVTWARSRAGFSIGEAEKIFRKISQWESGETLPTYPQLEQLSEKFKVPVAVFFFPEAPDVPAIDETFRTLSEDDLNNIPAKIRLLLRKASAMQINLAELNDGINPAKNLITRDFTFSTDQELSVLANELRDYLGITIEEQFSWGSTEDALENWRQVLTEHGIYVFKDAFREESFYGFCLYDESFPIIYVNNSSAKTRQIFTIFHELAHLLFHTSGIDVVDDAYINTLPENNRKIEVACNRFAAQFLVPENSLNHELRELPPNRDTAALLAGKYKVSREVIYRKLMDRGLISNREYSSAVASWNSNQGKRSSPGGNYYYSQLAYLGKNYVGLAFEKFYQNRFDIVQLADYLNITPKNVHTFEDQYLKVSIK